MKSLKLGFVIIICSIIGLGIGGFNLEPDSISAVSYTHLIQIFRVYFSTFNSDIIKTSLEKWAV